MIFFAESKIAFASERDAQDCVVNHQYQKALEIYNELLSLNLNSSSNSTLLYGLACTLRSLGQFPLSICYFQRAIDIDPNNISIKIEKARTQLLNGDLIPGFAGYELRREHPETIEKEKPFTQETEWDGQVSLNNKTILAFGEKGFEDTCQFVRFLPMLKQYKNVRVIAAVQPPLKGIISLCPYIDEVITLKDNAPEHDYYVPLMSLPAKLGTRIGSIPLSNIPYLFADTNLTSEWKARLSDDKNVKIGLCSRGNNFYFDNPYHGNIPTNRSFALALLIRALSDIQGISLYCLQQVTDDDRITNDIREKIIIFDDRFDKTNGAFMDTAAVINDLDVVVTIDTVTAHLAGGLGKPTFILLSKNADWRHLTERDDSPWYAHATLIRQDEHDNWDSALVKLPGHVTRFIQNKQQ